MKPFTFITKTALATALLFSLFGCNEDSDSNPAASDNGTTGAWEQSKGTEKLNIQALLTHNNLNFAGGATGTYLSTDEGATYTLSNNGNDSVGPTRAYTAYDNYIVNSNSQGVFFSSDNGATWVSKSKGITDLRTSGLCYLEGTLFVVTPSGIFKTTDNGDNWVDGGLATKDIRSITKVEKELFVGTFGEGIYKSVDLGKTWTQANNGLNSENFRAIETKGTTLFAAGSDGVYRSTDKGASWTHLANGLGGGSYRGFANNDELIVAGAFGSGVYYSKDNGESWTAINEGLSDLTIFDLALNEHYIIAATNKEGVFRFPLNTILK